MKYSKNIFILSLLAILSTKTYGQQLTPFVVCLTECYVGDNCNECDTALEDFGESNYTLSGASQVCNDYLYTMADLTSSDSELSTAYGNCVKDYASSKLQDGVGKTYIDCYGQCAIDNVMEIERDQETNPTPSDVCQLICMSQNDCGEYSSCLENTLGKFPYYYMDQGIVECEVWGKSTESDHYSSSQVSTFFGDCLGEMATFYDNGSDEKNFLTCMEQCTVDYDVDSRDDEEDDTPLPNPSSWNQQCAKKQCIYEVKDCQTNCYDTLCPADNCIPNDDPYPFFLFNGKPACEEYLQESYKLLEKQGNQEIPESYLTKYDACVDAFLTQYSDHQNIVEYYQCHKDCAVKEENQEQNSLILYFSTLSMILLSIIL